MNISQNWRIFDYNKVWLRDSLLKSLVFINLFSAYLSSYQEKTIKAL